MKQKLSKIAKILIIDQTIGKVIDIFLDIFFTAYFYKISQQNILYITSYKIIGWVVATILALLVSDIIKRKDKIKLYRVGIFVKTLYIFIIIILGNKIIDYIYIIGIMKGISTATTGFPFNMIESENIKIEERGKYLGYAAAAKEITSLVFSILIGAYINIKSYEIAAIIILIFSILKLILSFMIKNKNIQKEKVELKEYYKILKQDTTLKKLYIIEFFKGINVYGVMSLIVSLLIIYESNNELEIGSWTSVFSLVTIISMYLFGKYYQETQKKKILVTSLIIMSLSSFLILYQINKTTIIIYNIAYYVFMNIILKITELNLFNYSNKEPFKTKYNTEYFVFREIFLNTGRTLGLLVLLLSVGITRNMAYLNILFILIIISIIIVVKISQKLNITNNH